MIRFFVGFLMLSGGLVVAQPAAPPKAPSLDDQYVPGPDSRPQPGVPKGTVFKFTYDQTTIYPGTTRTISVYVPEQYTGDKPACVYVALDGFGFSAPVVFDNLIHKKEIPIIVGIGISPGTVPSAHASVNPRFNRSFEFDGLNGDLARLVLEEILPAVEARKTPGGLPIRLSRNPDDRCTAGGSTGAIAAFTLAWERPDAFRRVFSAIGTYVGMRGGDRYPVLVRKTEPKPIRIFLQDGAHDQWMGGPEVGDWWISNQAMQRALTFSGYAVEHAWGEGTHNGRHAETVFPDAMRWLWKDWPQGVTAGPTSNLFLKAILQPGTEWEAISGPCSGGTRLAADREGTVFVHDPVARNTRKIATDGNAVDTTIEGAFAALAFGPDGRLYAAEAAAPRIAVIDASGKRSTFADGIQGADLVVTHDSKIYVVEQSRESGAGKAWLLASDGRKTVLDSGLRQPEGIALSPDGLWMSVAESSTHVGYVYRVQPDGTVDQKQRFYWLHVPDWADDSGARAWRNDRDGRLYSATRMGVQVLDRNGRSRAILPVPGGEVTDLCFGGANFDTLFVVAGGKVLRRQFKVPGAPPWSAPMKLPPWGGG